MKAKKFVTIWFSENYCVFPRIKSDRMEIPKACEQAFLHKKIDFIIKMVHHFRERPEYLGLDHLFPDITAYHPALSSYLINLFENHPELLNLPLAINNLLEEKKDKSALRLIRRFPSQDFSNLVSSALKNRCYRTFLFISSTIPDDLPTEDILNTLERALLDHEEESAKEILEKLPPRVFLNLFPAAVLRENPIVMLALCENCETPQLLNIPLTIENSLNNGLFGRTLFLLQKFSSQLLNLSEIFSLAVITGASSVVQYLLSTYPPELLHLSTALQSARSKGHEEIISLITEHFPTHPEVVAFLHTPSKEDSLEPPRKRSAVGEETPTSEPQVERSPQQEETSDSTLKITLTEIGKEFVRKFLRRPSFPDHLPLPLPLPPVLSTIESIMNVYLRVQRKRKH